MVTYKNTSTWVKLRGRQGGKQTQFLGRKSAFFFTSTCVIKILRPNLEKKGDVIKQLKVPMYLPI